MTRNRFWALLLLAYFIAATATAYILRSADHTPDTTEQVQK